MQCHSGWEMRCMEQSAAAPAYTSMCRPLIARPVKCCLAKLAWPTHSWGPAESDWSHSSNMTRNGSSWPSVGQQLVRSSACSLLVQYKRAIDGDRFVAGDARTHAQRLTQQQRPLAPCQQHLRPSDRLPTAPRTAPPNDSARNKSARSLDRAEGATMHCGPSVRVAVQCRGAWPRWGQAVDVNRTTSTLIMNNYSNYVGSKQQTHHPALRSLP
jgi:hypothetical protein